MLGQSCVTGVVNRGGVRHDSPASRHRSMTADGWAGKGSAVDQRARGHLGLSRVRLFDQLDAATSAGPAVILAPAGFGKSTLLAQYARRHAGPAAAYQADTMEVAHGDTAARL